MVTSDAFKYFSFNRRVDASVIEMGKLLYEVKGGGQGQAIAKSEVQAAADAILQPLMDLLDGSLLSLRLVLDQVTDKLSHRYILSPKNETYRNSLILLGLTIKPNPLTLSWYPSNHVVG